MFANTMARGSTRRGIVLVLILGMLGLLALIGVTFATFAGQSLVNARNFALSEGRSSAEQYMDFALGQLINDTNNPLSALRGHSLLRDMYGNDSVFRGTTAADFRGYLATLPQSNGSSQGQYLQFTAAQPYASSANQLTPALRNRPQNYLQYRTNIPTARNSYQYNGLNFTRWIVRVPNITNTISGQLRITGLAQTFEVLEDDDTGTDNFSRGFHLLTLSPIDTATRTYNNASLTQYPGQNNDVNDKVGVYLSYVPPTNPMTNPPTLIGLNFTLDGRYMRAFNGPGMSRALIPVVNASATPAIPPLVPFNAAAYANFKVNGILTNPAYDPQTVATTNPLGLTNPMPTAATFGDPDLIGMDEDYDACDLENWFLAIQSADGQVVVPSFHRPSILTALDWTQRLTGTGITAQEQMNAVAGIAKILRPRQIDNSPQFPPDPSTPDATGKLTYDVDNDGDGVTDSVWIDLGYPVQRDPGGKLFKPLFAFMVLGQNGRLPLNTVGNLQDRDPQYAKLYTGMDSAGTTVMQYATAATYYDAPNWDHTSHVGASVNEVNPKYALQNAPANIYSTNVTSGSSVPIIYDSFWSQVDNAGIDVALTQLRALLAGTIPQDNPTAPINTATEANWVAMNGTRYYMPNMVIDPNDSGYTTNPQTALVPKGGVAPVPGRWGEPEGIPQYLSVVNGPAGSSIYGNLGFTPKAYTNPVAAGRSFFNETTPTYQNSFEPSGDPFDDDLDSYVPYTPNAYNYVVTAPGGSNEFGVLYDGVGQVYHASQRLGRFLTPTDPSGNGQVMNWMNRPDDLYEHGSGNDQFGRVSYFRYFRPPGAPLTVTYPFSNPANLSATSQYAIDAYKMPVLSSANMIPNDSNNPYHSYESFRAPAANTAATTYTAGDLALVAIAGAMPYEILPPVTGTIYPLWPSNGFPTMGNAINSESGPFLLGNGAAHSNADIYYTAANGPGDFDNSNNQTTPLMAVVANGYPLGSLNKDEADEMNLYQPNRYDEQFGPSDLEWLYRKQDVDGSTLNSRLSQLAPISFTNTSDGQTRRRLFSLESWELNRFVWANDNPQNQFPYNSRFAQFGNSNFAGLNQVPYAYNVGPLTGPYYVTNTGATYVNHSANANTVEAVPNPTLEGPIVATVGTGAIASDLNLNPNPDFAAAGGNYIAYNGPPSAAPAQTLPVLMTQSNPSTNLFTNAVANTASPHYPNLINGLNDTNNLTAYPASTPPLAHFDRRINLNMPLPIASDPAEPVRQKWCRETYQLLKSILPPQSVDTPEELAALSQFVVNIIDFRDPDATMTRFVNTDLMITQATATTPSGVKFAETTFPPPTAPVPFALTPNWDASGSTHTYFPFDPMIANEQSNPSSTWVAAMTDGTRARPLYLVQYGMEYNPIAINEVLAYTYFSTNAAAGTIQNNNTATPRFFIELVNTLADDTSHYPKNATPNATPGSGDLNLAGWDFVITPDTDSQGRPDPITGNLPALAGLIAGPAYAVSGVVDVTLAGAPSTLPPTATSAWGTVTPPTTASIPVNSFGWSLDSTRGLYTPTGALVNPNTISFVPALRSTGPLPNTLGVGIPGGMDAAGENLLIGDGYYVIGSPLPTSALDRYPAITGTPDFLMPSTFFPNATAGTPPPGSQYYWLHLRRPANPFNPSAEMVVVDSMRFPYTFCQTKGQSTLVGAAVVDSPLSGGPATPTNQIFSAERLQPYRGGHHVPRNPPVGPTGNAPATPLVHPVPASAWGYSEQTTVSPTQTPTNAATIYGPNPAQTGNGTPSGMKVGGNVFGTIGTVNNPVDPAWDYFPFHDRDFNSVAELLLVPGCSPGLFTKQFAEFAFNFNNVNSTAPTTAPTVVPPSRFPIMKPPAPTAPSNTGQIGKNFTAGTPHSFPYLNDEFYYTAVSVNPSTDTADAASNNAPYPTQLGGWTGAGWHKMFDFFEVPSSANGAVGTTDAGENFDWLRADRRPGMLNLNLIIDEEVFFGLIDDQRLNIALAQNGYYVNSQNLAANSSLAPVATLPQIISQVDYFGNPATSYFISDPNVATYTAYVPGGLQSNSPLLPSVANGITYNPTPNFVGRGFSYADPAYSYAGLNQNVITGMKAAFADFIKLRHGGTNFLFGHQAPFTVPALYDQYGATVPFAPIWPDKPYRSLSYPDINYTIMRPATPVPVVGPTVPLPPAYMAPVILSFPPPYQYQLDPTVNDSPIQSAPNLQAGIAGTNTFPTTSNNGYIGDPGVRFPWMDLTFTNMTNYNAGYTKALTTPMIPPIPPRRLFQPPDQNLTSNANFQGDITNLNKAGSLQNPYLTDPFAQLIVPSTNAVTTVQSNFTPVPPNTTPYNPSTMTTTNIPNNGGNYTQQDFSLAGNRQHPYYRTELLQKVMNLATVRTHQFAVWITVGFFEVTRVGTPELGVPDILGAELDAAAGKNVRYRSFFVIDRTKATGFNPSYPGEFRDCVTYRRRIE